ncbi:alpha/beta hydrolase [Serpentinicella sp. ANB-PHB4]|uniref:intracellular short-chain-length polyhydroxyalkanoate depolymerase n=1 Tax=Serpentinicella sp. ANB-PHB4 TaxID=3074076 RepID=UPI00285EAFC9|nr:alpha/beta hydrolase [Serpentinicella sp. ANB-PHB4]MDR5659325.1 alpha/beta hydrolase [Serpentinicella sp. ANB-PHB4]
MSNQIVLKSVDLKNGETLSYREAMHHEYVIVLVHGNLSSSKNWDILMESLDSRFKVYAVDLRGFGESTYNKPITNMKDFSDDLKLFVDKLKLKKFTLVGWSAGGAVTMQFAANYPKYVEKLILIESASTRGYNNTFFGIGDVGSCISIKDGIIPFFKNLMQSNSNRWLLRKLSDIAMYLHKKPPEDKYEAYIDEMTKQRNLIDINYALTLFNISNEHNGTVKGTGEVDHIKAPTLVIQGDRDLVVTMDMAKTIVQDIGENAQLIVLEKCGHSPLVDRPEDVQELITRFVVQ